MIMAVPLQMGVKTGTVAKALTDKYHRLPAIGACFDVCVAGFALQGGLSLNFRYRGTAADYIQSMDVVTIGCASLVPDRLALNALQASCSDVTGAADYIRRVDIVTIGCDFLCPISLHEMSLKPPALM